MVPHCSDGWRCLGPKDAMVVAKSAKNGWRKHTEHGTVSVYEYHLPTSPGKYMRRYMLEAAVSATPCQGRVTVEIPTNMLADHFQRIEELVVCLGLALESGLRGVPR
jgi:hypothetical protein